MAKKKQKLNPNALLAIVAVFGLAMVIGLILTRKPGGNKPKIGLRGAAESGLCKRAKASLETCIQRNKRQGVKACGSILAQVTKECDIGR